MRTHAAEHLGRRSFLKSALVSAGGLVLPNWGGLFNSQSIAAQAQRQGKRCILLWMAGGASHLETFDMKSGRPNNGVFRSIESRVPGTRVCEYLPSIAQLTDKLAIIRSMSTNDPGHSTGTYRMHTGYRQETFVRHPDNGALVATYNGRDALNLPSFIQPC